MKKPNASQAMALAAARMATQYDEPDTAPDTAKPDTALHVRSKDAAVPAPSVEMPNKGGRPRGKRPVAARQTLYLDESRHAALVAMAEDRGRSIHSLLLEGVDLIIGKPNRPGWHDRDGFIPPS